MKLPVALTIAGSDPSGGAGIQADLKTFAALDTYGAAVVAALTVQNTRGVTQARGVEPAFVADQIEAVLSDLPVSAVKTGMLFNAAIIEAVAAVLARHQVRNLVVDPVMVATSGHRLLLPDAVDALKEKLIPLARIVTPNGPEAADLTGIEVESTAGMKEAAKIVATWGPEGVVVKGGHLKAGSMARDILFYKGAFAIFERPWIDTPHTHGSGCTYAAALTAYLAGGHKSLMEAVSGAEQFIQTAIETAWPVGHGKSPVNHLTRRR